ncbi:hypothetical protein CE91St56_26930 [Lachnospiraceae bacterium]|nr:hypothetical protein CE91St56_26930 [Lachnospiraceae bacterium]GKH41638.1 hypothetical protein CE91St57_26120 [Lachnospiraceae bacterium]
MLFSIKCSDSFSLYQISMLPDRRTLHTTVPSHPFQQKSEHLFVFMLTQMPGDFKNIRFII